MAPAPLQPPGSTFTFFRSVSLTSPTTNTAPDLNQEVRRASSMDKPSPNYAGKMVIPTFTVTINPMEEDEVTYDMVPPSTAHPRYTYS